MATKKESGDKAEKGKSAAGKAASGKASAGRSASAKSGAAKSSAAKSGGGAKRVDGIHKPVKPSDKLGAIVGNDPIPRSEVISRVWSYIRDNKLQDPKDGRQINADAKLKPIFGKDQISMFEMNKRISEHLSNA